MTDFAAMGGWTCGICNTFVPWGCKHQCGGWAWQESPPAPLVQVADQRLLDALARLEAELGRIRALLERAEARDG